MPDCNEYQNINKTTEHDNYPDQLSKKLDIIEKRVDTIQNTIISKLSGIMRDSYPSCPETSQKEPVEKLPPFYNNVFSTISEIDIILNRMEECLERIDTF